MRGVSLQLAITTHLMETGEILATPEEIAERQAKIKRLQREHDTWFSQPVEVRAQQLFDDKNLKIATVQD